MAASSSGWLWAHSLLPQSSSSPPESLPVLCCSHPPSTLCFSPLREGDCSALQFLPYKWKTPSAPPLCDSKQKTGADWGAGNEISTTLNGDFCHLGLKSFSCWAAFAEVHKRNPGDCKYHLGRQVGVNKQGGELSHHSPRTKECL